MRILLKPAIGIERLRLRLKLEIHRLIKLERRQELLWLIDELDLRMQSVMLSEEGGDEAAVEGRIDRLL